MKGKYVLPHQHTIFYRYEGGNISNLIATIYTIDMKNQSALPPHHTILCSYD
jgi:hypothetical protein